MSTCTTLSNKHAVSFCELDDSVNFTNIRDGFIKQSNVHCSRLKLFIELIQLIFNQLFQLLTLLERNLNVNLSALRLIKEIDKY